MKRSLTEGNVTKSLLLFAAPMILGNLMQQLYNIVDTWVVGKYVGADALASAGSAYTLMTFLNSIIIGLCMGSGATFSYYHGRGEQQKMRACMHSSFVLIGAITVGLSVAVQIFLNPILHFMNTPSEVYVMMKQYVFIVFLGIIFIFLYNYYAFLLRALGNSVTPLMFLGIAAVLNVVWDLLFVLKFHWGLAGAAVATVMAQAVSGIGLAVYTYAVEKEYRFSVKMFLKNEKPIGEILKFSTLTCIQQSVMNFGILLVQGLVNSFGTAVMAAFAAAVKVDTFAYMPAQEFGNAYSIFISQNYGAGRRERLKEGTKKAFLVSALFCVMVSFLVFTFSKNLMEIFVKPEETEIIGIGIKYLCIEGAFYVGIGVLFLLYGFFRGINQPGMSLILTVISLGTRVALAYILAAVPAIGVLGIWWSIPIGWALADAVGLAGAINYLRKGGEIR